MLTTSERSFTMVFMIILTAELLSESFESLSHFRYFTKPAIVISLIFFFWKESGKISMSIRYLTLIALALSLIGDVLLLFVEYSAEFFMFGLIAFLLAHVMYFLVFFKKRNPSLKPFWVVGSLAIYALCLFVFLKDSLGMMLIPVFFYMLVILTMAASAFFRKNKVSTLSYHLVTFGAVLFVVSDSLLALDKFHRTLPFGGVLIMLTYTLAQYFIVIGIKKGS